MNINSSVSSGNARVRRGRWTPAPQPDDCEGHMPRIGRWFHSEDVGDDTEAHMPRLGSRLAKVAGVAAVASAAGVALFGGSASAAGPEPVDVSGDGIADAVVWDRWNDGSYDIVANDVDQNGLLEAYMADADNDGYFELTAADTSANGVIDVVAIDTTLDGYWDTYLYDRDENGVEDSSQWENGGSVMIIGAPTNPDGWYQYFTTMAGLTGVPVYGTVDSDHDGWNDNVDYAPYDSMYH